MAVKGEKLTIKAAKPAGEAVSIPGSVGIEARIVDDKLILEIELDGDYGPSASGKTHVVASTGGAQYVTIDGLKHTINFGLWVPVARQNGGK